MNTLIYPTETQAQVDSLISLLDILYNEEHPQKYTISELYTDATGSRPMETYELYNLTMECDKGMLIASDKDEILWNEEHCIHAIITEHIEYITFQDSEEMITLTIGDDEKYGVVIRILY